MATTLRTTFGNPSSVHRHGQEAKTALDEARAAVARLIGAEPTAVIFTSGGSEADNLAIRGAAVALADTGRRHLVASAIEHEAVLQTLKALSRQGWTTTLVGCRRQRCRDTRTGRRGDHRQTALVSVMHANNEIGTIQPVADLARLAHAHGALFHTDAVQSVGKLAVDVADSTSTCSRFRRTSSTAPRASGRCGSAEVARLTSQTTGGKQERNRRAGHRERAGIVGFGAAARLALDKASADTDRVAALREPARTRHPGECVRHRGQR